MGSCLPLTLNYGATIASMDGTSPAPMTDTQILWTRNYQNVDQMVQAWWWEHAQMDRHYQISSIPTLLTYTGSIKIKYKEHVACLENN